jgi:integrase
VLHRELGRTSVALFPLGPSMQPQPAMTALVPGQADLARAAAAADVYLQASLSSNTRATYDRRWSQFTTWCTRSGCSALPAQPGAVALFLSQLAAGGASVATVRLAMAARAKAHETLGVSCPTRDAAVRAILRGIARTHGAAPRQADALTAEQLVQLLPHLGSSRGASDLQALRDRAMVLTGWIMALRRSELVALQLQDLRFDAEHGVFVTVRRSKTDQEGLGRQLLIPFGSTREVCPVRSLQAWIARGAIARGPLFRRLNPARRRVLEQGLDGEAVCLMVAAAARRAGLEGRYTGHSLRAGFVTSAARRGKRLDLIMQTTGHRRPDMVLRYTRPADLTRENAAMGLL